MPLTSLLELGLKYWDREVRTLPAEVGVERTLVQTRAELYEYNLEHIHAIQDTYFPFYTPMRSKDWPLDKKDSVMVNRIFIDLDTRLIKEKDPVSGIEIERKSTFEEIWSKGKVFYENFWPNIELFFSGGKGFHIYLYILPTTMGELRQHRERMFAVFSTWFQYLLDKKAFLSLDRICRTTFTKHSIDLDHPTLPRWKVPVEPTMTVPDIMRESTYPRQFTKHFSKLAEREPEPIDYRLFLQSPDTLL